ncbi:MAG: SMC-Scp complex subunit ScpB [Candidatus Diapherotrites archaeon]|nr:SMC-Scp complex subunit ScpB [Candidatus Diapherotrites archaeon]
MIEKQVVEAALFLAAKPLSVQQLAEILETGAMADVETAVKELQKDYSTRDSSLEILNMGKGYKIHVKPQYLSKVSTLAATTDLGKGDLRTLAFIVFNQPVKQSEVVKTRGSNAYSHIKKLREMSFVRAKKERNTYILETGKAFRKYFGEDPSTIKERLLGSATADVNAEVAKQDDEEPVEHSE